LHWVC